jgi:hypothetical protein
MDETPIVDIKPYLPYTDCIPEALGGFAATAPESRLQVQIDAGMLKKFELEKQKALIELLRQDPRPHYQDDPSRTYGLKFASHEIKFRVEGELLIVIDIK